MFVNIDKRFVVPSEVYLLQKISGICGALGYVGMAALRPSFWICLEEDNGSKEFS